MVHAKVQMVIGLAMCFGVSAMLVHVAVTDSSLDIEPASAGAAMDQLPQGVLHTDTESLDGKGQLQGDSGQKNLFSPAANSSLTSSLAGREVVSYDAFSSSHASMGSAAGPIVQPNRPSATVQQSAAYLSSATYSTSTAVSGSSSTSGTSGSSGSSGYSGSGGGATSTAQAPTAPASSSPARGGSVYPAFQSPAAAESRFLTLDYIASSSFDIDEVLPLLEPLPKVHYYWPLDITYDRESPRMMHLTRITHTQCVYGEYIGAGPIDTCVYRCAEINRTGPAIAASIGVNFCPWHRRFDPSLPPTDRGPTYDAEIEYFTERMTLIRGWVQESNERYGSNVAVSALLLDSERFTRRTDDPVWNQAMTEALDAIHAEAVEIFPDATIVWYGRGMALTGTRVKPHLSSYWTGDEQTQVLSCELYTVPDIERMRLVFSATCEYGVTKRLSRVIPYLALGAGFEVSGSGRTWRSDWPYEIEYSRVIGAELNLEGQDVASTYPLSIAEAIVFFPPPFRATTTEWPRHFAAYVVGATQSMPE